MLGAEVFISDDVGTTTFGTVTNLKTGQTITLNVSSASWTTS